MLNTILVASTLFFAAFILYKMFARETGFSFSLFNWKPSTKWLIDGTGNNLFVYLFVPTLLFAVLFAVLWLTDDKLGWFSFMTRDRWTFTAFVITYLVFASAFMQDEEKRKKTPFYQIAMVVIMIMAVDFALIGINPADILKNPFNWSWITSSQPTAQVVPSQVLRPAAMWSSEGITKQGVFTEIKVPVPPRGCHAEWSCQDGAFVGVVYKKLPQGIIRSCEETQNEPLDFGEVQDLRLTFMSTDPAWYKARFVCN